MSTIFKPTLASIISGHTGNILSKPICTILINNNKANALINSGSMDSFINPDLVDKLSLTVSEVDAKYKWLQLHCVAK